MRRKKSKRQKTMNVLFPRSYFRKMDMTSMLPISYNNVRDILYNTAVINSIFKLFVHSPVGKLV